MMGEVWRSFLVRESKLYPLLEALDIKGPESMVENNNSLNEEKNHHINSLSHQAKKCNDHCIDCFSVFCHK